MADADKIIGPELQRLIDRLVAMGATNFTVSWAPDAWKATAEDRARSLNEAFDCLERGDYEDMAPLDDDRPQTAPSAG